MHFVCFLNTISLFLCIDSEHCKDSGHLKNDKNQKKTGIFI